MIERRAGISAIALAAPRDAWGLGRPAPVLASLSIGFLALIARRNKLAAGAKRDHGE